MRAARRAATAVTAQRGMTIAPGRGSSSSTISSTVTSERSDPRTISFWIPTIPHSWTLPARSARWAWTMPTSGASRHRGQLLAGERARDLGDVGARLEVGFDVAAQDREGQVRGAGRIAVGHAGVGVLLELDGTGQPFPTASRSQCSEPTPGLPPHENTSRRAQPIPIIWS